MNLIEIFQDLVAQVPALVQPLIVAAAGAVPFIEGEGAAAIGIIGGIHPAIAAVAGIVGNFVCVAVLVLLTARTRVAVVTRTRERRLVAAGGTEITETAAPADGDRGRGTARKAKFQRALERYGVPGVSLLGPLLLPTQFTATLLAGAGVRPARILFWQGLAIVAWTTLLTFVVSGAMSAVH
ncbi:small multidrug efflux protein [Microbacterium sp. HD4P20]|uniref:small multidrug efflux protein n=1 Tax=Microbacterium sp. HD4P20 TaxID=2864874 RepID=UPI001C641B9C|nr:small multidrug efflux protein [Microbacterium sp. HD4P20]MCP2637002.1 small multidrug efflux protein [Microbacterium sp. HD4P20]